MAKKMMTAEQVKKKLNIPDFRHLTRDKLIEFVSAIPDMDQEVAIKIIEQFPAFSEQAKVMMHYYSALCDAVLKENSENSQTVLEGYRKTLDTLGDLVESDDIDISDRRYFAEKMVEVADKMAAYDASNKEFLSKLLTGAAWFFGGLLLLGAALLGVNIKGQSSD